MAKRAFNELNMQAAGKEASVGLTGRLFPTTQSELLFRLGPIPQSPELSVMLQVQLPDPDVSGHFVSVLEISKARFLRLLLRGLQSLTQRRLSPTVILLMGCCPRTSH